MASMVAVKPIMNSGTAWAIRRQTSLNGWTRCVVIQSTSLRCDGLHENATIGRHEISDGFNRPSDR